MGSRQALKAKFEQILPDTILVTADPGNLTSLDPSRIGGVQIVRAGYAPTDYQGQMLGNWELWLYVEGADPDAVEDDLEQLWAIVFPILDNTDWLQWTAAEYTPHPDGLSAIRVTAQTITTTSD